MTVPDIGESMTPVFFSGAVLASSGTNGVLPGGFEARVDGSYSRPELGDVDLTNDGSWFKIAEPGADGTFAGTFRIEAYLPPVPDPPAPPDPPPAGARRRAR